LPADVDEELPQAEASMATEAATDKITAARLIR
jgi:hypothetical protein